MTDGIGRLSGYGNYRLNGYFPQQKKDANPQAGADVNNGAQAQPQDKQLDPTKVMDFLSNNTVFVNSPEVKSLTNIDNATKDRVAASMENFELIYSTVVDEFGEDVALDVMNLVMPRVMGMTE